MTRTSGTLAVFAVLVLAGCGRGDKPPMADASGTVTYNGAALEGATVMFIPDTGMPSTGVTDAAGRFTFNTRGDDGAVVGPGKVAITAVEQLIVVEGREPTAQELANMHNPLIPDTYGHPATSGLTAEVKADEENNFTFDLTGPPMKRVGGSPKKSEPPKNAQQSPTEA